MTKQFEEMVARGEAAAQRWFDLAVAVNESDRPIRKAPLSKRLRNRLRWRVRSMRGRLALWIAPWLEYE